MGLAEVASKRLEEKRAAQDGSAWQASFVCVCLFVTGAVSAAGWAPLGQVWVTWLAFAFLAACAFGARGWLEAGLRCLCFAVGLHAVGHGWVLPALLNQTEAGRLWSWVGSIVFVGYLASFLAVPVLLWRWLLDRLHGFKRSSRRGDTALQVPAIGLALLWTAGEALRGTFFNGFDSLAAGYLFTSWPWRGWIPLVGVYGASFLFYASTGLAAAAWSHRKVKAVGALLYVTVPLVSVAVGGAALDGIRWVESDGGPRSFRLVQGGVAQGLKFDLFARERQSFAYTEQITAAPADLIITPETAFAMDWQELQPSVLNRLRSFSAATGSHIFIGMPHREPGGIVRNSIFQMAPGQAELPRYDKKRLMPFGEYAPVGWSWLFRRMNVPLNDQTPGLRDQPPFELNQSARGVRVGTLICNDDLSQADARHWAGQVGLLINPSNLTWFESSWALPQRLQVAQVRALESGRPILRVTNSGVTAHIDEKGRVVARLESSGAGWLSGSVQPTKGLTPFARSGNLLVFGLVAVLLLFSALAVGAGAILARRRNEKSP